MGVGGGGLLTMRKCSTLLMETHRKLSDIICVRFFSIILQIFSGNIIAHISTHYPKTFLTISHPDSAWKRSSKTCMKLSGAEYTVENS